MVTMSAYVDRVNERAAQVDWRRVILFALMALPFVIGYAVRLVTRSVGWVLAWLYAAAVEGYRMAGPRRQMP